MAASPRRRRFERATDPVPTAVTPQTLALLHWLSILGLLTSRQLMRLCELTPKSGRRLLRDAFDGGLVDIVPLPRSAFLDQNALPLGGSAPNLYTLSRAGMKALAQSGEEANAPARDWRERSAAFLTHAVLTREVAVYFACCAHNGQGEGVLEWHEGGAAELPLGRVHPPRIVRPDARLVAGLGDHVLSCLIELDRGTERLATRHSRWRDKLTAYGGLFASGKLKELTGYINARVLVVTTTQARTDAIASFLSAEAAPDLFARFWLTALPSLESADLIAPIWRQPGRPERLPLVSPDIWGKGEN